MNRDNLVAEAIEHYDALLFDRHLESTIDRFRSESERHGSLAFGDRLVCTLLRPYMIDARTYHDTLGLTTLVARGIAQVTEALLENEALRRQAGIPEHIDALLDVDRVHGHHTLISRTDGLFDTDGQLKFIEHNPEPGMTVVNEGTRVFDELPITREFSDRFPFRAANLFDRVLRAIRKQGVRWTGNPRPVIGVLAKNTHLAPRASCRWVPYAASRGVEVRVGDAEGFEYTGGKLLVGGSPVDLLQYTDPEEFMVQPPRLAHIFRALRDGAVTMVGGFSRQILASYKQVFAVLSDPVHRSLFDMETKRVLDRCIPWTRVVRDGGTTYEGRQVDLLQFIQDNQQRLVLKPTSGFGGLQVFLGWKTEPEQWREATGMAPKRGYVVQERVELASSRIPLLVDPSSGEVEQTEFFTDWDPYVWGCAEADQALVRAAPEEPTNIMKGGGLMGVWVLDN